MENSLRLRRIDNTLILDLIGDVDAIEFDVHLTYIKKLKYEKLFVNIANLDNITNDLLTKFKKMKAVLKNRHVCFINVDAMQIKFSNFI